MSDLKSLYQSLKLKHLLVGLTFGAVLTIRLVAANLLEITKPESQILFEITRNPGNLIGQASILYQILTVPLIRFFGSGNLVVRFWPVLATSVLILLPIFLEDIFGSRPAVLLAFLLALDPFLNANAIQINGSALTICCLALLIVFLQRRKFLRQPWRWSVLCIRGNSVIGLFLALSLRWRQHRE